VALLDRVKYPKDLRGLSREELRQLVDEVRERHIDVVSRIGGHFGASLGVAELTVALHYVFDTPRDRIVWTWGTRRTSTRSSRGATTASPRSGRRGG